jgi:rifampicin phosphotransferase
MPDSQTPASTQTQRVGPQIEWELPEDARLFWTIDKMHFGDALSPLTGTFEIPAFDVGVGKAFEQLGMPVRMRAKVFNDYQYNAMQPVSFDPAEMERLGHLSEERVRSAMMGLERDWNERYLPELKSDVAVFRAFDYAGATNGSLADHVDWVVARRIRHWHLHFLIVIPQFISINAFTQVYSQMFNSANEFEPLVLLQGLTNRTVEGGHALWRVSRLASRSPEVREALTQTEPEAVFARLRNTTEGRGFTDVFREYLDEFGWRGDSWNMDDRTWVDYPKRPLATLRGYLAQPDEASPELKHQSLIAKRETAIAHARAKLVGASDEQRGQFEGMLHAAQLGNVLHEDHNYYIDQMLQHLSRRAFVAAGQRLVDRNRITTAEDVLYLTVPELKAAIHSSDTGDLRDLVDERRKRLDRQRSVEPPHALGTPPPPPQPGEQPNPLMAGLMRFFGGPVEQSTDKTQIRGNAGSRGKVTGIARVATSLEQAAELSPGEILVCTTTSPPWTPLFATAAAVVTDTGGILSHCAVVAREFGIPAVVGTHVGTSRIKTGQRLTVDGSRGIVTIES